MIGNGKQRPLGSQLQTELPTKSEAELWRGLWRCGIFFVAAGLIFAAYWIHISGILAADLTAGGLGDPDKLLNRAHILIYPLVVLPGGIAFVGMIANGIGWGWKRMERSRRRRRQLRQWEGQDGFL